LTLYSKEKAMASLGEGRNIKQWWRMVWQISVWKDYFSYSEENGPDKEEGLERPPGEILW
jgi:hypothetical protein